MQPITTEQAQFLLNAIYLPALKTEQRTTKNVIEAIPLDKGDYSPDPFAKTALELAWHIAVTEMRFMDSIEAGEFDLTPRPRPESVRNSADLVAWYDENFASRFEKMTKLTDEQLTKSIDFRGKFQMPAVGYLGFVTQHSIHHRGQLSTYLRPMGSKVPAIYGESYDSARAQKA